MKVRNELTDATNVDEILEEIEETWIEVKRRTRTQEPQQTEEVRKNRQVIQTFVKVGRRRSR